MYVEFQLTQKKDNLKWCPALVAPKGKGSKRGRGRKMQGKRRKGRAKALLKKPRRTWLLAWRRWVWVGRKKKRRVSALCV
jgi:hypothetical protein